MTRDDLLRQLRAAAGDLSYPSDADEPFEPFAWPPAPGDGPAQVRARAGTRPVEVVSVESFFADLGGDADAARFAALRATLQRTLAGLAVVRVAGSPEVDVYLIGRAANDLWAGLRTTSVET